MNRLNELVPGIWDLKNALGLSYTFAFLCELRRIGETVSYDPVVRTVAQRSFYVLAKDLLIKAGCKCFLPLIGMRPLVGPRCRTCNVQADVLNDRMDGSNG